jgi:predicted DNA-binding transcriptional regulator AlpA
VDPNDELLTSAELATLMRVDSNTPALWRLRGRGPKWFKLGDGVSSPVRYRRSDVNEWLESRMAAA